MSSSERWLRAPLAGLAATGRIVIEAEGLRVAVFYVDGTVFAVDDACPHAGNPLSHGEVLGRTLVCAYHSWRFDLETGACLFGEEPVRRYPVEERDGAVWVDLGAKA